MGGVQAGQRDRPRHLATRRQAKRLSDGTRNPLRLAARRASPQRGAPDQHLRQQRRATRRGGVPRAADRARSKRAACSARAPVHTSATVALALHGQRASCCPTATSSSVGADCRTSRSSAATAASSSTRGSQAAGQNYRAFRLPWQARPHRPPRLVAHTAAGLRRLYVSWNGATEVARWRLEAGPARNDLQPVLTRPKQRFETSFPSPRGVRFATAVALDASGQILGRSNTIRI